MEKETLEEAAKRYANDWEEIHPTLDSENMTPIAVSKIDFIEGAKWQAERMYSEEDMIEFAKWVFLEVGSNTGKDRTNQELFNEWSEQFKKK